METIKINDIEYIRKDQAILEVKSPIKIVVLQRGWVLIGRYERSENQCFLKNAYVIRVWGTSKGLGELVEGPTHKTILDKCNGIVEFEALTKVLGIDVREEKWNHLI